MTPDQIAELTAVCGIAWFAMFILAVLARHVEPYCPQCPHCRAERRRAEEVQAKMRDDYFNGKRRKP